MINLFLRHWKEMTMPGYLTGSTRPFPISWRINGFVHPMDLYRLC